MRKPLTGVVTRSNLGLYVPIVTTPNRLRTFGSRCSISSSPTIASYPSRRELYFSMPPSQSSAWSSSHRGRGGGKVDEGEGGVMTESAEGMTLGEQSSAARRCEAKRRRGGAGSNIDERGVTGVMD